MNWNWQQPDWPRFAWRPERLAKAEERFLLRAGELAGVEKHLADADRQAIAVDALSDEAVTTSEIEGEILERASVQCSIRRELGLAAPPRRATPAERGVAQTMVDLHRTWATPLDDDTLFEWHRMLMSGRSDLADVGRYRTHHDPMRVVSGRIDRPRIHFEAPPSTRVPDEMRSFVAWFNDTAPSGPAPLPALTRAGSAHLYFESIHPFEDGNGRIGRAISEKALAQSCGRPTLIALAATILAHRADYYRALEAANKRNEITDWLAWFAGAGLEAQQRAEARIEFAIEKFRLLDRVRPDINQRQEKALMRLLREGPDGFEGGLSAGNYTSITKASSATTTRDLSQLVELGALRRTGERRHARYHLTTTVRPIRTVEINARGEIVER